MADEPVEQEKPSVKGKKSAAVGGKKLTQTEAAEVAESLLLGVGFIAAKVVENEDAALTDDEMDDILPHMTRMMMRMSPAASKRYRDLTDPLMFGMAVVFYMKRVGNLYQEKRQKDACERAVYQEQYGNYTPGVDQSIPGVDNGQSKNDSSHPDRRGGIFR